MFPELNNLCDISLESLPTGKYILVGEGNADGSFVISHMLSLYLKANQRVCFLGLSQTFTHYNTICSKLGINLSKCRDEKRLIFHNGINDIGGAIVKEVCGEPDCDSYVKFGTDDHSSLRELYTILKESLNALNDADSEVVVIIDDLSVLVDTGIPAQDIIYFMQYLRHYVQDINGCLVTLTHYHPGMDDDELELLWKQLSYHCDISLRCKGLDSGYSREVHGQMIVKKRKLHTSKIEPDEEVTMQYKIADKNVTFFAPGLSAAVL